MVCITVRKGGITAKCCLDVIITTVIPPPPACTVPNADIVRYNCSPCFPSQHPDWRYGSVYVSNPNTNPNITYTWSASSNVQFITGNGGPDIILRPTNQGIFTLTLTIRNSCGASSSKTITVDPQIDCPVARPGECDGNDDPHRIMTLAPNPVKEATTITYQVEEESTVDIVVTNEDDTKESWKAVKGKKVVPGSHEVDLKREMFKKKGKYVISLVVNGKLKESQRLVVE